MLDVSLKAYVENNPDLAEAVCKRMKKRITCTMSCIRN